MIIEIERWYRSQVLLQILATALIAFDCAASTNATSDCARQRVGKLFPRVRRDAETRNWRMSDEGAESKNYLAHPCKRECVTNQSMTCYYYLVVHYDETMGPSCDRYTQSKHTFQSGNNLYIDGHSVHEFDGYDDCKFADGVRSQVMVVNGQLPGQTLVLCAGDTLVADIINSMHETTTMHWHGIHQLKSPHMDGVPHVTQYPIEPGQAFRYRFEVDQAGTHWWHSHTEHQRAFGLAGALIVRQPSRQNLHSSLYDFDYAEHIILIQDWVYNFDESIPQSLLIGGLGRSTRGPAESRLPTLYSNYKVVRGGRYRFRVIVNGIANCPISLSIDKHNLVVIATDGNDIEPITVQTLTIHGGERFDFVLHANQAVANYWLRVKGLNFCAINKLHQEAIVHYMGADRLTLPQGEVAYEYAVPTNGVILNAVDAAPGADPTRLAIVEANALDSRLVPPLTPFRTYYMALSVVTKGHFRFQIDDITFTMPRVSLLQTRNLGNGRFFCNKTQQAALGFNCRSRHCKCTNIIQVPAFKNVEFAISSRSEYAHPIHLHGYTFRVVGMGVLGEQEIDKIEEIDRQTPLQRRQRGAPLKDTVQVPAFGYTIIRFYTGNPGYWIIHCHISTHSEQGMAAVLRVGDDEQMKMCPVSNCGLCSSVL